MNMDVHASMGNDVPTIAGDESVISVQNVSLTLPIRGRRGSKRLSLPREFQIGGTLKAESRRLTTITALNDVSFNLGRNECVALIGHNGAGKSSLLRVLAGIYTPTHGKCVIRGKVSTLFNSSLGLSLEGTGYENTIMAGTLLGLNRSQISDMIEDVIDFTELGDFFYVPLRAYSSGMKTRLSFAISTAIQPDIMLIDEIFGAGDSRFQEKAKQRMRATLKKASILIMASHSEQVVRAFCGKGVWLSHGKIVATGPIDEVLSQYKQQK